MIPRTAASTLRSLAGQYPVITVTGPRQSGKTTLCQTVFPDKPYVNLERPDVRAFARDDPNGFLAAHPDGAILDEIQRVPELSSWLQAKVDAHDAPGQFVLTGSQQFEVMDTINQTLAGRTALIRLLPFDFQEVLAFNALDDVSQTLYQGFYPRLYDRNLNPTQALGDYFETYIERDLRQIAAIRDLTLFESFVRLCAGRVGQLLNLHNLANDTGISHTTARAWLSLLEASYIVYQLRPWHTNTSKRLIKSPKLYFYDTGLACYLLGIEDATQVFTHPQYGALFENMIVMEILKQRLHHGHRSNLYFYRDANGNEVDLVQVSGNTLHLVEIKAGATVNKDYFKGLKRFRQAFADRPASGCVIYAGTQAQQRSDWPVIPWNDLATARGGRI